MITKSILGAGLTLLCGMDTYEPAEVKKPNVLLIIVDDLRNELNCYGVNYIKSPNIDQLAENGYLFTRAYVQHAVCSASRASFLTGCRPATVGVTYPYSEYFVNEFMPQFQTIPEFFEQQGYQVYTFGKVHHGSVGLDQLKTDHFSPSWLGHYALEENIRLAGPRGRSNLTPPFESADVPDETYQDGAIALEAVKTIKKVAGSKEPFFLAVGFMKPHLPFNAPKKYWDMYTREEIGLAENRKHPEGSPSYSTSHHALNKYSGPNDEDGKMVPEDYQITLRHGYAACVSFIDAQIGKLMSQLRESGALENTIVMFISDHGWHLGEQQMWGKTTNFENSTISPMIISVPGKDRGVKLDQFVEYVDIYPSLQELAGFPVSDYLEGTSFVPLLREPGRNWKKAAFSQQNRGVRTMGYAIRTKDFRYVEWRRNEDNYLMATELYDHRIDPLESKSLASEEAYKDVVADLSLQLELGWKAALPEGITNNSNNPPAPPPVPWGPEASRLSAMVTNAEFVTSEDSNEEEYKANLDLKGLSNPNVTRETAFLYSNLKRIGQQGIIFGHHHASFIGQNWRNLEGDTNFTTDTHKAVGDDPGLFGFDFGRGITMFKEHAEEVFRRGGISTFSWHCSNPITGGGYRDMSGDPVTQILTNEKYLNIWKGELDKIADFFNNLYVDGVNVPVIFRPFHENTGSWFWWGRVNATSEQFIELWRITADYLRVEKGVDNMLLAYSPSYSQYVEKDLIFETYPGDDYVDIIGIDTYNQDEMLKSLLVEGTRLICEWTAKNHKIPALTELGIRRGLQNSNSTDWFMDGFLNQLKQDEATNNIAFVLKWMNTTPENYWVPLPGQPNYQSFVNFYKDPTTFFLSDLKNIYGL